jgi:hypothetical protein
MRHILTDPERMPCVRLLFLLKKPRLIASKLLLLPHRHQSKSMDHGAESSSVHHTANAGESLSELIHGVNLLMQQVRFCCAVSVPSPHRAQVCYMKQKIETIQPSISENLLPKGQSRLMKQKHQPIQQHISSRHAGDAPLASSGAARSQAADRAERPSKDATGNGAKQPRMEKKRPSVAFGCCLRAEPPITKAGAASKPSGSNSTPAPAALLLNDPDSISREEYAVLETQAAADSSLSSASFNTGTAAAAPSSGRESRCSAPSQALSEHLLHPVRADKVKSNQGQQWPRLERALQQYRRRACASDSRHKEQPHFSQQPRAAGDSAEQQLSHPHFDPVLGNSPCCIKESREIASAADRSHSLALLGFSGGRVRCVETRAPCALSLLMCFSAIQLQSPELLPPLRFVLHVLVL